MARWTCAGCRRAAEGFPPLLLLGRPAMRTGNKKENRGARGIINSSGRNGNENFRFEISNFKFSSWLDGHAQDVGERPRVFRPCCCWDDLPCGLETRKRTEER